MKSYSYYFNYFFSYSCLYPAFFFCNEAKLKRRNSMTKRFIQKSIFNVLLVISLKRNIHFFCFILDYKKKHKLCCQYNNYLSIIVILSR